MRPELLELLQDDASEISRLISGHWESVINQTEDWPRLRAKRGEELATDLRRFFVDYLEKTLHWLDYFVMDPGWLNLTAVNYAANAAREAASEVRQTRLKFEEEYELERDDLAASSLSPVNTDEEPESRSESGEPGREAGESDQSGPGDSSTAA